MSSSSTCSLSRAAKSMRRKAPVTSKQLGRRANITHTCRRRCVSSTWIFFTRSPSSGLGDKMRLPGSSQKRTSARRPTELRERYSLIHDLIIYYHIFYMICNSSMISLCILLISLDAKIGLASNCRVSMGAPLNTSNNPEPGKRWPSRSISSHTVLPLSTRKEFQKRRFTWTPGLMSGFLRR